MDRILEASLPTRLGILLALLTLVYGFGLGIGFGAAEDWIKGHLKAEAGTVLATVYAGDEVAAKAVVSKSWVYMKRAHLHANGLGTSALALILLLCCLSGADRLRGLACVGLGAGALGYAAFWMFAGLRAPGLGSTGLAKESLAWLAIPSSGLCVLGLLVALGLFVRAAFVRRSGTRGATSAG
jgi:hypothetical protein